MPDLSPSPEIWGPYKRTIRTGQHSRPECLTRPGLWCQGIGWHEDVCSACPVLRLPWPPPDDAPAIYHERRPRRG